MSTNSMNSKLYLASQSPRRRELLATLGVEFESISVDIDESVNNYESANTYVMRLAIEKAKMGLKILNVTDQDWVLGSDTSVVIDNRILGKPTSQADFEKMMQLLSGRTHSVFTAVALTSTEQCLETVVETKVQFAELNEQQIKAYWLTGEPTDKAGGYGIQGLGSVLVESITGSYSSVVGLPLRQTAQLLSQAGLPIWHGHICL